MATNSIRRLKALSVIGPPIRAALKLFRHASFSVKGSASYWNHRYSKGGNSGAGSYGRLAEFKAFIINDLLKEYDIQTVIEFGCGDGHQLELARYNHYVGFDVSSKAVDLCRARFPSRPEFRFAEVSDYAGETADLSMSLDVIYHLVEDEVFQNYMKLLFDASTDFVLIYSCDAVLSKLNSAHVKTRQFSDWIKQCRPDWQLVKHVPNLYPYDSKNPNETSIADFYLYQRQGSIRT